MQFKSILKLDYIFLIAVCVEKEFLRLKGVLSNRQAFLSNNTINLIINIIVRVCLAKNKILYKTMNKKSGAEKKFLKRL